MSKGKQSEAIKKILEYDKTEVEHREDGCPLCHMDKIGLREWGHDFSCPFSMAFDALDDEDLEALRFVSTKEIQARNERAKKVKLKNKGIAELIFWVMREHEISSTSQGGHGHDYGNAITDEDHQAILDKCPTCRLKKILRKIEGKSAN